MRLPGRFLLAIAGTAAAVSSANMFFSKNEKARAEERKKKGRAMMHDAAYYQAEQGVNLHEEFVTNSRGNKLHAIQWLPLHGKPKALIFLLHGYGVECGLFWSETGVALAKAGFAVHGLDYEGHGLSDGLQAYIPDMDHIVDDCIERAHTLKAQEEYAGLPSFLYGQSMGGAVALLVHRREPRAWAGAVLIAPMCKISDKLKPPAVVVSILVRLANVFPTLKMVPSEDVTDNASKDPDFRKRMRANPFVYQDKPRLKTAVTLLHVSNDLEKRLEEVSLPFLLLHGEADRVTDPAISQALYERAQSTDKTFKLYPDMWHSLTEGDTEEACGAVWKDIFEWVDARCPQGT